VAELQEQVEKEFASPFTAKNKSL